VAAAWSVARWPVDELDEHDHVIDDVEDEHPRPSGLRPTFR
jgi:hypothetical protein